MGTSPSKDKESNHKQLPLKSGGLGHKLTSQSETASRSNDSRPSKSEPELRPTPRSLTQGVFPLGNLESPFDIDPKHHKLLSRWEANKKLRESGLESKIAQLVLGPTWRERYHGCLKGEFPLAWPDQPTWLEFLTELMSILKQDGITGHVGLRGSSSTFLSMHPEKGSDPDIKQITEEFRRDPSLPTTLLNLHYFDCKIIQNGGEGSVKENYDEYKMMELYSDIDFNIKSPELIEKLKNGGAVPSSNTVGACYNQDDTMNAIPLLWDFKSKWTQRLKRDISFVGITDLKDTYSYTKHPFTFEIR